MRDINRTGAAAAAAERQGKENLFSAGEACYLTDGVGRAGEAAGRSAAEDRAR